MRKTHSFAITIAFVACAGLAQERDALAPVRFLIGEWKSAGEGKPGEATGVATFAAALRGAIITRTSYADYPASATRPAYRHEDLMVIYADGGALRADYFDNERHTIRYAVSASEPNRATFLSDAVAGQTRYRLIYVLEADGTLRGSFELAPPDKPDAFSTYLTWASRRK